MGVSYESHFGFLRPPFSLAPDPRFLFDSLSHAAACDELVAASPNYEALVIVTGEIGTGKTTLCRALAARLGTRALVALLTRPPLTREELVEGILRQFGVIPEARGARQTTERELMEVLERFLAPLESLHAQASVVIDEAQHLPAEVFEQLRVLADLTSNGHHLLQVVLVGQPELEDILDRPDMRALGQRVTRRHRLGLLGSNEVGRYIALRVNVAASADGARPAEDAAVEPFTSSAVRDVARLSRGVPRLVNVMCDRALESAFTRGSPTVSTADVIAGARQLKVPVPFRTHVGAHRKLLAAVAAVLIAAVAGVAVIKPGRFAPAASATTVPRESQVPIVNSGVAPAVASLPLGSPTSSAKPESLPEAGGTVVIVSAFRTLPRAMEIAGNLARRALPAFARPTASGWQQVVLGPYASREEAASARTQLVEAGFPDSQIVQGTGSDAVESTAAAGQSKRVVSLSVPGRTSILIEGVSETNGPPSTPAVEDGRLVVDIGRVEAGGWTRTLLAKESLPFVQEIALAEVSRDGAMPLLRATVTVRNGATVSLRAAGHRVYLDFVPRPE